MSAAVAGRVGAARQSGECAGVSAPTRIARDAALVDATLENIAIVKANRRAETIVLSWIAGPNPGLLCSGSSARCLHGALPC